MIEICFWFFSHVGRHFVPEEPQENCLYNIFGVLASTGHAKRRAVNQIVMRQKNLFEFRRQSVLWRSSRSNRRHTLLGKQNSGRHQLLTGKSLSRMKCPPL